MIGLKVAGGSSDKGTKVTAEVVQKRSIIETVSASGQIYPELEVPISPDISGEVVELNVTEGDSVRKGQVLARIYADIYADQRNQAAAQVQSSQATVANSQAGLEALRAQTDQSKTAMNRNKQLLDDGVISRAEYEQTETAYRTAQAQYNAAIQNVRSLQANTQAARTNLQMQSKNVARAVLTAPMDGVVTMLKVKKGERVVGTAQMAGTQMMTVADIRTMEVRVEVGENDIVKVSIGDSADVKVEAYNNRKFRGIVTKIANSTATGTGAASTNNATMYAVHIRLDPSSYADMVDPTKPKKFAFRPGMNASAEIKTKRVDGALSVPTMAVAARVKGSDETVESKKKEQEKKKEAESEGAEVTDVSDELEEVVFIIKQDGTIEKRSVTTGIQDMKYIEVLSGVKVGEKIVSAPFNAINKTLKTGDKVKEVTRDELLGGSK
jgi:HlyD family secretion protein